MALGYALAGLPKPRAHRRALAPTRSLPGVHSVD